MDGLVTPHDSFFKALFTQPGVAQDFLAHYLPPQVAELLDLSTLEREDASFVDAELRVHLSDLLYRVHLRDGPPAWVYILFEHKSFPDPLTPFQLLRYMVRLWERSWRMGDRLKPIVPVVVYHGRVKWKVGLNFACLFDVPEAFEDFLPDYRYWLCDLTGYSDEEIKG